MSLQALVRFRLLASRSEIRNLRLEIQPVLRSALKS